MSLCSLWTSASIDALVRTVEACRTARLPRRKLDASGRRLVDDQMTATRRRLLAGEVVRFTDAPAVSDCDRDLSGLHGRERQSGNSSKSRNDVQGAHADPPSSKLPLLFGSGLVRARDEISPSDQP